MLLSWLLSVKVGVCDVMLGIDEVSLEELEYESVAAKIEKPATMSKKAVVSLNIQLRLFIPASSYLSGSHSGRLALK
jgi:hypothetical protein